MGFASLPAIQLSFYSDALAVRGALQQLRNALKPLKLDTEELGTVELVVAEALNNVVEHAYPEGQPAGPVRIKCKPRKDGLHITIIDEGLGMPEGETPMGKPARVDVDLMEIPEGGFGWFLIRDLAKDVEYKRVGWENQLSMRVALGK